MMGVANEKYVKRSVSFIIELTNIRPILNTF